ncbi:MAG: linear amide C-N hydrolase [Dictyoglomus sp.]|nr:linear amide C-N hydrolase [Dictyoglomus sp.]MDW8189000.1 C45 family peptidase [Dictyoglomus sp.]
MKRLICFLEIFILISTPVYACSIFWVRDNFGHVLVGRNFDNDKEGGRIWFIPPSEGKYGIVILEQLGKNMPYEGMNEKGLFIGISAVPNTLTPFEFLKPIRISLEMVKIVLERAQNVDEAIEIFSKYYVIFGTFLGNPVVHYLIVDRMGNSAVIEYVDGKKVILKNSFKTQILTNHFISKEIYISESPTSLERYDIIRENLVNIKTQEIVKRFLDRVKQETTCWSSIYYLDRKIIQVKYRENDFIEFDLYKEFQSPPHGYDLKNMNLESPMPYREDKINWVFRLQWGNSYIDNSGLNYYGLRLLVPLKKDFKMGIEYAYIKDINLIGFSLEKRYDEWLHLSLGMGLYFVLGEKKPGVNFSIGWEPENTIPFKPYLVLRSEILMENSLKSFYSIISGFNFEF